MHFNALIISLLLPPYERNTYVSHYYKDQRAERALGEDPNSKHVFLGSSTPISTQHNRTGDFGFSLNDKPTLLVPLEDTDTPVLSILSLWNNVHPTN